MKTLHKNLIRVLIVVLSICMLIPMLAAVAAIGYVVFALFLYFS